MIRLRVGFVLAVLSSAIACHSGEPLEVTHASPTGDLRGLPTYVEVHFNKPIIDPDTADPKATGLDISTSPKLAGKVYFPTPNSLSFAFADPVPPATKVDVTIDSGLRTYDQKAVLKSSYKFSFTSERNGGSELERIVRTEDEWKGSRTADAPAREVPTQGQDQLSLMGQWDDLLLTLRYPEQVATLKSVITVTSEPQAGGAAHPIPVTLMFPAGATASRVLITPNAPWPIHSNIKVNIAKGLGVAVAGAGTVKTDIPQTLSAATYPELTVVSGPTCDQCVPPSVIAIEFSTPVDCQAALAKLAITPAIEQFMCSGQAEGSRIVRVEPSPALKPHTEYTLTVGGGISDSFGQTLATPKVFTLKTGDSEPRFAHQMMFNVLERLQKPEHEEMVFKTAKLDVSGARLPFAEAWKIITSQDLVDQVAWDELPWWLSAGYYAYFENDCYWDDESDHEVCDAASQRFPGAIDAGDVSIPNAIASNIEVSGKEDWTTVKVPLEPYLKGAGGIVVLKNTPYDARGIKVSNPVLRLINVTDIGLSAKYSTTQLVVMAARLSDGKPIAGADIDVYMVDEKAKELGAPAVRTKTDAQGIAVIRAAEVAKDGGVPNLQRQAIFVTAKDNNDEAFIWSKFRNGGSSAPRSGTRTVGSVYTERGIYRPGETVYYRVVARRTAADGFATPSGSVTLKAAINDYDSYDDEGGGASIYDADQTFSKFGTVHGSFTVPADAQVGEYALIAKMGDDVLRGTFRVGEFRRAEMQVTVATDKPQYMRGATMHARVNADYLFGAPAAGLQAHWTLRRQLSYFNSKRFPSAEFSDYDYKVWYEDREGYTEFLDEGDATLDDLGSFTFDRVLKDASSNACLEQLIVSATVDDASGQSVSSTTSVDVHPASVYVGIDPKGYLREKGKLFSFDVVAVTTKDEPAAHIDITVNGEQEHWYSVKRKGPGGLMYWEYEHETKKMPALCSGTTNDQGVLTCQYTPEMGGSLRLKAVARDDKKREVRASSWFWVTGDDDFYFGRSDDGAQVSIMPEKSELEAGETARIAIASPFKQAMAMITVEREDILWRKVMPIGTSGVVDIPIPPEWAPNVWVSVTAVRGRVKPEGGLEADPERDKPAYALGYMKVKVKPTRNVLKVALASDKAYYEPGDQVSVSVSTADWQGKGTSSEVNLYAVDEGVLMLTGYRTPDIVSDLFDERQYAVLSLDTRMHVLGRRKFIQPAAKGEEDGGGGGSDADNQLRKDFNPVAVWIGALTTDGSGKATQQFKVPDTLTTYRVMAVAATEGAQFGAGATEFKVNKTLMMRQAMPRFVRPGDRIDAGVVVNTMLDTPGEVSVEIETIDDALFDVKSKSLKQTVNAKATAQFRFNMTARDAEGASEIIYKATMNANGKTYSDRVQLTLPVKRMQPAETVGVAGVIDAGTFSHTLTLPEGARPTKFELNMSGLPVASLETRMRGLVQYPYGCLEQRTSVVMPLVAVRELSEKMGFASIPTDKIKTWVDEWVGLVPKYRCGDQGFDYYPGCNNGSDPYLTAFVLDALLTARRYGYKVPDNVVDPAAGYLQNKLASMTRDGGSWDGNSGMASALRVLAELGKFDPARENAMYEARGGMPLFAKTELTRAIGKRAGPSDTKVAKLVSEITASGKEENGIVTFAATDPQKYWWAWDSQQRSTALVLRAMLQVVPTDARVPLIVRGLVGLDGDDTYYTTQATTQTLLALAEAASLMKNEGKSPVASATFAGASIADKKKIGSTVDTVKVEKFAAAKPSYDVTLTNSGTGPLYFGGFFSFAYPATARLPAMSQGFAVTRTYTNKKGDPIGDSVRVGDYVMVSLVVSVDENGRMVVVSDPLPAGLEPVDANLATADKEMSDVMTGRGGDWSWWQSRYSEMRDDRTDYSFRYVWSSDGRWPIKLKYLARATTPGNFYAPGTVVERMYQPEIRGRGEGRELRVLPKAEGQSKAK